MTLDHPPLVVLGCRPLWSNDGDLKGALGRRVRTAWERRGAGDAWFLVSGGRTWGGVVEADAMADALARAGVPRGSILRERCSLTTRDNARLSAAILRRIGVSKITLVTCEWHMARAAMLFRRAGVEPDLLPAPTPATTPLLRWYRAGHEWVSTRLDARWGARG